MVLYKLYILKYFKMYFLDNFKVELLFNIQREKLEFKKSLFEVEKKKLDVFKEICFELKRKNCCCFYFF